MSYTQLVLMNNDGPTGYVFEFGNSWGGAFYIWNAIFNRYMMDEVKYEYDNVLSMMSKEDERSQEFWDLYKSDRLAGFERTVLSFTYDYALVYKKDFEAFAEDLRKFSAKYARFFPNMLCHLDSWSKVFEMKKDGPEVEAIGLYATSVGDNFWYTWDEEKEEDIPFDLKADLEAPEPKVFDAFLSRDLSDEK